MEPRFDYRKVTPGVYEAMAGLEKYLGQCSIEVPLIHLLKLRASQLNLCPEFS